MPRGRKCLRNETPKSEHETYDGGIVADPDALIGQTVSHYRISALASRPALFENSLLGFLSKTSGERRKLNVVVDWTWDIFFKPNLVELRVAQQQRFK